MTFPPVLLGASYLNTQGYKSEAAGLSAAWSALYLIMARRTTSVTSIFKPMNWNSRGLRRGATFAMCLAQGVCGTLAYTFGSRKEGTPI